MKHVFPSKYSQTKVVMKSTTRFRDNWEKIFEKKKPEECDLTPVPDNDRGVFTHLLGHRFPGTK